MRLESIKNCTRCPRLREYCAGVAQTKKKAFIQETYWGLPVPGFGDLHSAKLLIVGLAPAAHGANRTGRIFTGDQSGLWLYHALYKQGFANQPTAEHKNDGLNLIETYVTCVVHCAPPDNKPSTAEVETCLFFFKQELAKMPNLKAILFLGQFALTWGWKALQEVRHFETTAKKVTTPTKAIKPPPFKHGQSVQWSDLHIFLSYHPSQQNTFTKRLTEPAFDSVFKEIRQLLNKTA